MTPEELATDLETDRKTIREWVKAGLPVAKKRPLTFDRETVIQWLLDNQKIAEVEVERILLTRDEVARELKVSTRTIANWLREPDFPGRAGDPGRRNGYYPVNQIKKWRANRGFDDCDELGLKIRREILRRLQLQNQRQMAGLIDKESVESWTAEAIEIASQVLAEMKSQLLGQLDETPERYRQFANQLIDRAIQQGLTHLKSGYQRVLEATEEMA